jgi:RNA 3'-terminal phosphate cyclase
MTIDGSMGEGGGQVLRSSLAFSLLGSIPFRVTSIRAKRARPGLMRQHLVAVNAAATIGDAEVSGAELGSTELVFRPKRIRPGDYTFSIGGAGSTTLVFHTILFPLMLGTKTASTVTFEGGTHNPMAPPVPFLERTFLPVLARMGGRVDVRFERHGFNPAGGGRWAATETIAESVAREVLRYLAADVPVGEHLADQLLVPMALGSGGAFRTVKPTAHCLTQIELAKRFLDVNATMTEESDGAWRAEVRRGTQ